MNKEHILKSNLDFQRIIKSNRPYKYKEYVIYLEKNNLENYRFGFSVGKKIGKAVARNHIKRQLKNIVSKRKYKNGFDCIIIVNKSILEKSFYEREKDLNEIFKKINIYKKELEDEKI